jgi:hypothetical protein
MTRIAPHRPSIGLLTALLLMLIAAPAAGADVGATIIERCTHGQSVSGYSQQAYSRALAELPTEVEEYSDCANRIRSAQLAAVGGGSGAGAGGAPIAPIPLTPAEQGTLARIVKTGPAPVQVGGQVVSPGVVHADVASALSTLPDPLLAVLAFLVACALLLAGAGLRNRVRANRSD